MRVKTRKVKVKTRKVKTRKVKTRKVKTVVKLSGKWEGGAGREYPE